MQDEAKPQATRISQECLTYVTNDVFLWPEKSPDINMINVIENVYIHGLLYKDISILWLHYRETQLSFVHMGD